MTVLADRGFGDQALYELLRDHLGLDFVARFRSILKVTIADGETKSAKDWGSDFGRRFTIEQSFRDRKNLRFGMGLSDTRIGDPDRRDRMLLISAIAIALLTILGAAGEAIGSDLYLKANTVKRRTISPLNQGLKHYGALPKMKLDMLEPLMAKIGETPPRARRLS